MGTESQGNNASQDRQNQGGQNADQVNQGGGNQNQDRSQNFDRQQNQQGGTGNRQQGDPADPKRQQPDTNIDSGIDNADDTGGTNTRDQQR